MKLIVGLGNPGKEYEKTRHNIGFMVLDKFMGSKEEWQDNKSNTLKYFWLEKRAELIKPITFMNDSGKAVGQVKKKHPELKTENILIIHDDLDIELGRVKMTFGKSAAKHKGVDSVIKALRSKKFWRLRIGVLPKRKPSAEKMKNFLLGKFLPGEDKIIKKVIKKAARGIELWLESPAKAMNFLNQK